MLLAIMHFRKLKRHPQFLQPGAKPCWPVLPDKILKSLLHLGSRSLGRLTLDIYDHGGTFCLLGAASQIGH